jgi:hypothetical protein
MYDLVDELGMYFLEIVLMFTLLYVGHSLANETAVSPQSGGNSLDAVIHQLPQFQCNPEHGCYGGALLSGSPSFIH